jgi:hypothetical protein
MPKAYINLKFLGGLKPSKKFAQAQEFLQCAHQEIVTINQLISLAV